MSALWAGGGGNVFSVLEGWPPGLCTCVLDNKDNKVHSKTFQNKSSKQVLNKNKFIFYMHLIFMRRRWQYV